MKICSSDCLSVYLADLLKIKNIIFIPFVKLNGYKIIIGIIDISQWATARSVK